MPLLDHFHPPWSIRRHWESFHATWTVYVADALGEQLPENYVVEVQTHAGARVEIDVATFDDSGVARANGPAGTAVVPRLGPPPVQTMPAVFPAGFEVLVFATGAGPILVGAIAFVSPANKDRPETRRAFAVKCASYLYQGVSLIVVDVVTGRAANLHNEVMQLMGAAADFQMPGAPALYAVAYRPVRRAEKEEIDLWPVTLEVGQNMPVLPLVLTEDVRASVDLEATYMDACRRRRLRRLR
jgi:hypothetical protein